MVGHFTYNAKIYFAKIQYFFVIETDLLVSRKNRQPVFIKES